ncbi:MAG: hypothetical protein WCF36_05620 [Candidatus Nanopelagicales bacterium]
MSWIGLDMGSRRGRAAVLAAGVVVVVGLGAGGTAAAVAPPVSVAPVSVARAVPAATSPTPYPSGWMMGGAGRSMMDDDDWGTWHHGQVMTRAQARRIARTWVAAHHRGAATSRGTSTSHGYRFTVTRGGQSLGRVTVNRGTGRCTWVRRR